MTNAINLPVTKGTGRVNLPGFPAKGVVPPRALERHADNQTPLVAVQKGITAAIAAAILFGLSAVAASAADDASQADTPPEQWAFHGQLTNIWQYHPAFRSLFQGAQSLDHNNHLNETFDATAYLGVAPWQNAEFWVDPEIDQGIAPGDTLGLAGYINGDGSKVGRKHPYLRFQRVFWRQTVDLDDCQESVKADINQLAGERAKNRLVFTVGKFDVTDVFDTNTYAHDGRKDFLNWSLIDTGSFDYASDAWGYTYGAAGRMVLVRTHAEHIVVLLGDDIVADHPRNFRRDQIVYDPWHYLPVLMKKPGALRNGAPFKDWALPPALIQVRTKLKNHADGDRQFVKVLSAVLDHGLGAVDAACAEALEAGIASGDVILTVLARRHQPAMPPSITTPDALRLKIEPLADCGRYDSIRKVA